MWLRKALSEPVKFVEIFHIRFYLFTSSTCDECRPLGFFIAKFDLPCMIIQLVIA